MLAEIITLILAILAALLGTKFGYLQHKVKALRALLEHFDEAWEDKKITDAELEQILEDIRRLRERC